MYLAPNFAYGTPEMSFGVIVLSEVLDGNETGLISDSWTWEILPVEVN